MFPNIISNFLDSRHQLENQLHQCNSPFHAYNNLDISRQLGYSEDVIFKSKKYIYDSANVDVDSQQGIPRVFRTTCSITWVILRRDYYISSIKFTALLARQSVIMFSIYSGYNYFLPPFYEVPDNMGPIWQPTCSVREYLQIMCPSPKTC